MMQSTRQWLRRNRRHFAVGAGVLGAGYVAGQYVLGKLSEARQRMGEERIAKDNLRRRFQQNQQDCTFTVLAILPTATDNILDAMPVEQVLEELQRHKAERLARSVGPSETDMATDDDANSSVQTDSYVHASPVAVAGGGEGEGEGEEPPAARAASADKAARKSKAQLWNEMKITSITRALALLYTLALLTLLTRIQLNLLGRRNYLASVVSLAAPPARSERAPIHLEDNDDDQFEHAYGNDFDTNRRYLSLSWWLLHKGCLAVVEKVHVAVQDVFGLLNPRADITLQRLSELTLQDQEHYLFRASGMTSAAESASPTTTASLRRLIDETSDLIDSPSFAHVLTLLLDAGFSHLVDNKISQLSYKIPPVSESTARVQEIVGSDVKAKVANSLAVFCRQAHSIGSGANNEYLAAMEQVRDLEAFAAVVYSSNFEYESPEGAATALSRPGTAEGVPQKPSLAATTSDGHGHGFESAWDKALAKEDGQQF
ncbi:peroxin [Pleosporales sp. CAS-2024a]